MLLAIVGVIMLILTGLYLRWETKNRVPDRPYIYNGDARYERTIGVMEIEVRDADAPRHTTVLK
jgi:hypothetical protein